MGLDMYLYRLNKKITQEQVNKYDKARDEIGNFVDAREYIEQVEALGVDKFVKYNMASRIDRFDKWIEDGKPERDNDHVFGFVEANTPKFSDFETHDDLMTYYINKCTNDLEECRNLLKVFDNVDPEVKESCMIFDGVEEEAVGYWRKHADLNEYFYQLAINEAAIDKDDEFNCKRLVLKKEEIENLLEKVDKQLNGEEAFDTGSGFFWGESNNDNWIETKEIFTKVLSETDFDNQTIIYSCWY